MFNSIPFYIWWIAGFVIGFGMEYFLYSIRKDGVIHITHEEDKDSYLFEFNIPPEEIPTMSYVVFKTRIEPNKQKLQSP